MISSEVTAAYETGRSIRHKKGGEYKVLHLCIIKDGVSWIEGAVYESTLGQDIYCRKGTNFESFILLQEPLQKEKQHD